MTRRSHSLQRRLVVLVVGAVAAVWLSAASITWFDARHEVDELLDSHLAQAAALLVARQGREFERDVAIDAPALHRYSPKVAFQVFHEGQLVLRSANAPPQPMIEIGEAVDSAFQTVRTGDKAWRVFAARGAESDIRVYVGEELGSRSSILRAVLRSMLWPMLVALPLLALAVWWAIYSGVAPLRRLGRTLAGRQAQDLGPAEVADAPSEMRPLVDALNSLFQRIARLLDSERRFTADAAHELRTPIAAIQIQAQVALGESDDKLRRHALQAVLEGCERATHVVDQLLTLSRLEADAAASKHTVDLGAVVRRVVGELAPRAIGKRQTLELQDVPECIVAGDETLLSVLARNLVDNAVRYSPGCARVQVRLEREGGHVKLTIEDSGPGLSEPDLSRLGERFFRVPGSDEAGTGLGWSIARRIADVHGARLRARRSAALGGLAVEVLFPS